MMFNLYDLLFVNFFSMYREKLRNNKSYKLNIITITLTLYMEKKLTNNKLYITYSPCIELGLSYDV
jgi:hypothetical protein